MKSVIAILFMLGFIISNHGNSQGTTIYPIPSYNVQVTSNAVFKETHQSQISIRPAEKRVLDVQVKSTSSLSECQATVWVYSLDLTTVLGPYTVSCSQPLQVEIDERDWGVYVSTEQNLLVSVWIE